MQSELPQLAILNDFRLKRPTIYQVELNEYERTLGPLPEERPETAKPSRPGTAKPVAVEHPKPKVNAMEEGLIMNIIHGIERDLNERRKEFKAVIARLRAETSRIYALPGELRRFDSYKSTVFAPLKVIQETDEFEVSRDDLYKALEESEEKWFRDQQEEERAASLRNKLEEFENAKGLSKRTTEAGTYRSIKHKYIRADASHRSLSTSQISETKLSEVRPSSRDMRRLQELQPIV
mmetsp:Transcript_34798/g.61281  ORF Transcript_34798/g.61281 Transcript_34798/m.61281 type:complete len:236 (+) Transcript_34798:44-751(+)